LTKDTARSDLFRAGADGTAFVREGYLAAKVALAIWALAGALFIVLLFVLP
jgi:hypothetical protein